jgi:predicted O-methyltransferase YrrM
MNSLLEKIYETRCVEDSQGNAIDPFPAATPRETSTILYDIVQKFNCQKTLEVGMAYGLSTLSICQAHKDRGIGNHIAIDPMQHSMWGAIGLLNVKRAELEERFRFFEAPSDEALPQLAIAGERIDFAFIDGMHLFDYTLVDFYYIDKLLTVGGYIVFDDIWMPAIRKVVHYVLRNRNYELVQLENTLDLREYLGRVKSRFLQNPLDTDPSRIRWQPHNICLLKKIENDKRNWDFHRSF